MITWNEVLVLVEGPIVDGTLRFVVLGRPDERLWVLEQVAAGRGIPRSYQLGVAMRPGLPIGEYPYLFGLDNCQLRFEARPVALLDARHLDIASFAEWRRGYKGQGPL